MFWSDTGQNGHDLFRKFGHDETRSRVRHKFVSGRVQGTTRVRPNLVQKRLCVQSYPWAIVHLETKLTWKHILETKLSWKHVSTDREGHSSLENLAK